MEIKNKKIFFLHLREQKRFLLLIYDLVTQQKIDEQQQPTICRMIESTLEKLKNSSENF